MNKIEKAIISSALTGCILDSKPEIMSKKAQYVRIPFQIKGYVGYAFMVYNTREYLVEAITYTKKGKEKRIKLF